MLSASLNKTFPSFLPTDLKEHVDNFLIAGVVWARPVEIFAPVDLFFPAKHLSVHEHLELLVDDVDTQLLQAIVFQTLKPTYVENPYRTTPRPAI